MNKRQIGIVKELFRYPVKSMLGERPSEVDVGPHGVIGDRAYALREANGRVVTAKKWANMFEFSAHYEAQPKLGTPTPLAITLPDGCIIHGHNPAISTALSEVLGRPVTLDYAYSGQSYELEIDPATIFNDVPVEMALPESPIKVLPEAIEMPVGTFFDSSNIHVLSTGTLANMRALTGPDVQMDARRFRPNIVVETPPGEIGFLEDGWLEGILEVGKSVQIGRLRSAERCAMTTHRQADLARDVRILRTSAQHHKNHVGVFGVIGAIGTVRVGDPVILVVV